MIAQPGGRQATAAGFSKVADQPLLHYAARAKARRSTNFQGALWPTRLEISLNRKLLSFSARLMALATIAAIAGCVSSATVIPMADGHYQAIATSYSETGALNEALEEANAQCAARGLEAYVLTRQSQYQGVDKNAAVIIDAVSAIAAAAGSGGSYVSTRGPEDYRAVLTFKCGPQ